MKTDNPEQFYDTLANNYDLIYPDWQVAVRRQGSIIKSLITKLKTSKTNSILDCSCGIGTQAIGLALEGFTVHATDISANEIERAKQEAAKMDAKLTFGVADFRDLSEKVEGKYDIVLSFDNSLPHLLTNEDLLSALQSMKEKLNPDGLLMISLRDYDEILDTKPKATMPQVMKIDDNQRVYFQTWDWEHDQPIYTTNLFVLKQQSNDAQWEITTAKTKYRALDKETLTNLLNQAGYTNIKWLTPNESGFYQPIVTANKE